MGGGKSGSVAAETPKDIITNTAVGSQLSAQETEFDEPENSEEKMVAKKKLGTRGLRIPLEADTSTTSTDTAQGTGVQI